MAGLGPDLGQHMDTCEANKMCIHKCILQWYFLQFNPTFYPNPRQSKMNIYSRSDCSTQVDTGVTGC